MLNAKYMKEKGGTERRLTRPNNMENENSRGRPKIRNNILGRNLGEFINIVWKLGGIN